MAKNKKTTEEDLTEDEQEIWADGFEHGMNAHLEEIYQVAKSKGETYVKMVDELYDLIQLKYSDMDTKQ